MEPKVEFVSPQGQQQHALVRQPPNSAGAVGAGALGIAVSPKEATPKPPPSQGHTPTPAPFPTSAVSPPAVKGTKDSPVDRPKSEVKAETKTEGKSEGPRPITPEKESEIHLALIRSKGFPVNICVPILSGPGMAVKKATASSLSEFMKNLPADKARVRVEA